MSSEEKTGPALLGPILGISLLLNLIVIISLFLAFTSDRQEDDQFQRKVGFPNMKFRTELSNCLIVEGENIGSGCEGAGASELLHGQLQSVPGGGAGGHQQTEEPVPAGGRGHRDCGEQPLV